MKKIATIALSVSIFIACSTDDSGSDEKAQSSASVNPGISLVNVSDVSTADIKSWTDAMSLKMASQTANILSVSWNVGEHVSEGGFSRPFNTHQVTVTQDQIENIMGQITSWMATTCASSETQTEELTNFRDYLENGADSSAHLAICGEYRIVLMAFSSSMSAADRKALVIHEFYHAFQHDLADESCSEKRDSSVNGNWIVEGATDYFTTIEIHGAAAGISKMLEKGLEAYNTDSDTSIAGSAIAARGAAGIRYLIEKGSIQESDILDASFFHSCKSENDFTDSNAKIVETKENWYKIKNNSGTYSF
jgi:hypothetical protein